jgi:hypothetical protein
MYVNNEIEIFKRREEVTLRLEESFDYQGESVLFQVERDGMINLTAIAKRFPEKTLSKILKSQEMKEYLKRLSERQNCLSLDLLRVIHGNSKLQGTWAHPKVALRVCQKLSPDFAIWVDDHLEELLRAGTTSIEKHQMTREENIAYALIQAAELLGEKDQRIQQLEKEKLEFKNKELNIKEAEWLKELASHYPHNTTYQENLYSYAVKILTNGEIIPSPLEAEESMSPVTEVSIPPKVTTYKVSSRVKTNNKQTITPSNKLSSLDYAIRILKEYGPMSRKMFEKIFREVSKLEANLSMFLARWKGVVVYNKATHMISLDSKS